MYQLKLSGQYIAERKLAPPSERPLLKQDVESSI